MKSQEKKELLKKIKYVKSIRKIDRDIAIANGDYFITWMPKGNVHKDKKKDNDKKNSRKYKYKGE